MDAIDQSLIRELQGDIPLEEDPYEVLARRMGISPEEVVNRLKTLNAAGKLKRIGAILRHQKSGYTENAMAVFVVAPSELDNVAGQLAKSQLVSHCYERATQEKWPYNLYAMLHSREKNEIEDFIKAFAEQHGICTYDTLSSLEELKKSSMVYF